MSAAANDPIPLCPDGKDEGGRTKGANSSSVNFILHPSREEHGMELLIVEDEPVIGKALRQGFREAGHECVWAKDGDKGWELARSQQFDAIILDLMLPGKRGL